MGKYSDNSYFNYDTPTETKEVPLREQMKTPDNIPPFVRTPETGDKVYLVKDGEFHWITSPEVLKAVGGDFDGVQLIKREIFKQLRQGEKLTIENASSFRLPVKEEVVEAVEVPKNEFKTYDEGEMPLSMVPDPTMTSIIIPVYWKSYPLWHMTGNCIGSIREHTDKMKTPYEIILVINGEKENVVRMDDLTQTYADKVITFDENLGFAKAVNAGIRCARGGYIAIVNNDVLVFDKWLEDMQEALKETDLVMATPMYGKPFARAVEAQGLRNKQEGFPTKDVLSDFKDFSCVLTRKDVFNKVGLFNERFFMYCEDLDFMRRMDKEGLKYASSKRVNTAHIISATASGVDETPAIMEESKKILREIWGY